MASSVNTGAVYRSCSFYSNYATTGGAIYLVAEHQELVVEDTDFTDNSASMNKIISR